MAILDARCHIDEHCKSIVEVAIFEIGIGRHASGIFKRIADKLVRRSAHILKDSCKFKDISNKLVA